MRRFGIRLGVFSLLVLLVRCTDAPSESVMGPPTEEPPGPSAAVVLAAPISITDLGTLGGPERPPDHHGRSRPDDRDGASVVDPATQLLAPRRPDQSLCENAYRHPRRSAANVRLSLLQR